MVRQGRPLPVAANRLLAQVGQNFSVFAAKPPAAKKGRRRWKRREIAGIRAAAPAGRPSEWRNIVSRRSLPDTCEYKPSARSRQAGYIAAAAQTTPHCHAP